MSSLPADQTQWNYWFEQIDYFNWEPTMQIGISACVGTLWWIVTWFFYVKTLDEDTDQLAINGTATVPIGWFWYRLTDGGSGWMAASYFTTFWTYLLFPFLEMLLWIAFMLGEVQPLLYMSDWFFYSFIALMPAPAFAVLHIVLPVNQGGLNMN